jgi:catechol 2,3-dioxygenase-like lactoylglutathione lyase family enzyme
MPLPPPALDHVVIDVRDRMDEAQRVFADLGFHLTPRGHHTLGSMNHLAMFTTDYLELLGFGDGGNMRTELQRFPIGLNGLVFKTEDADAVHAHAASAGLPILPVQAFSRPVELAGAQRDAKFRTTRLDPARIVMGRVYFCEHLTKDLVWRPEWQAHPNGACGIARVLIATPEPKRSAALFRGLFGAAAVSERAGRCFVSMGAAPVELAPPELIAAEFGDAAAEPSGRREYLVGLEFRVAALQTAVERLRPIPGVRVEAGRVVVPAAAAFNTTLSFTQ